MEKDRQNQVYWFVLLLLANCIFGAERDTYEATKKKAISLIKMYKEIREFLPNHQVIGENLELGYLLLYQATIHLDSSLVGDLLDMGLDPTSSQQYDFLETAMNAPLWSKRRSQNGQSLSSLRHQPKEAKTNIVQSLLKHGVDINTSQHSSVCVEPYLSTACCEQNLPLFKVLLECPEINVNMQDIVGRTALHYVAAGSRFEFFEPLASHPKIDFALYDNEGITVLDCARKVGNEKINSLLQQKAEEQFIQQQQAIAESDCVQKCPKVIGDLIVEFTTGIKLKAN